MILKYLININLILYNLFKEMNIDLFLFFCRKLVYFIRYVCMILFGILLGCWIFEKNLKNVLFDIKWILFLNKLFIICSRIRYIFVGICFNGDVFGKVDCIVLLIIVLMFIWVIVLKIKYIYVLKVVRIVCFIIVCFWYIINII